MGATLSSKDAKDFTAGDLNLFSAMFCNSFSELDWSAFLFINGLDLSRMGELRPGFRGESVPIHKNGTGLDGELR